MPSRPESEAHPRARIVRDDPGESVVASSREGPRERLQRDGARSLSLVDLVALILRTGDRRRDVEGLARRITDRPGGVQSFGALSLFDLESIQGMGVVKSASLLAAIELGRRVASTPLARGQVIGSPSDVQRHFQPRFRDRPRESFHVLMLDGRHRLIAMDEVSLGTLTASLVHPREVFREAIRQAAAALLLAHHHPSGDPSPSVEDRAVTSRLVEAGRLLGIQVVDHVIVAEGGYFSFREAGWVVGGEAG